MDQSKRKHVEDITGLIWQKLNDRMYCIDFRLCRVEVYLDQTAKLWMYEIHGYSKLRSKHTFDSLPLAQLAALRKLSWLTGLEASKVKATFDEFVPF
jgi:hypothetical protein